MSKLIFRNIVRFILLVLFQVLVFNHINLFGYINPFIYISWVFLFPVRKSKSLLLLTSFFLGILIDTFSDTGGIHTAAILTTAYFRLPILEMVMRKKDFDYVLFNIRNLALNKLFLFISILTFLDTFVVFLLDYFNFSDIGSIISNTILTSIFTILISFFGILLFTKKHK
ncbi:MAG: rod shape-determining protein MreD [Lutibacter sp.]|uniref:rod shape-determining protein MreD n=1 Tax=Lutibacter sp. TaxID=1925666 RepID=UPI00299EE680|nr:rod shape-determining protein MreD [Lutibacter sp.]MDX1830353.1 rod shape-determining protein MreD [Lutibacter sp.]